MKSTKEIEVDMTKNNLTIVANPNGGHIFVNGINIPFVKNVSFQAGANKKAMLKLEVDQAALDTALIDKKILK
ncbi:hypothetical protein [Enterococcus thailandicus]|uniref:hypothetical protein n=1 Tax=Enterococcus thailandicus TaxID=417368 RepID=UPI0022E0B8C7|nr:hypothetical protein [Enterococcus thailandicus]